MGGGERGQIMLASIVFEIENMMDGHVKKPQSLYFWRFGEISFSV